MPERDELDRLIDGELSRYAEPRAGLEQRILARVDTEAVRRPGLISRWQAWVLVGAAAAAILLLVTVPRLVHRQQGINNATMTNHTITANSSESPVPKVPARPLPQTGQRTRNAVRGSGSRKQIENAPLPQLDVFPAPQPLSAQEQALLALATAPSDTARENLIASQRALNAPLQISAIEIPPITMPNEGNK
jgi:hypothetical protein